MRFVDNLDSATRDLPNYRKEQIYRAIFRNACDSWDQATNLPLDLRAQLTEKLPLEIDSKLLFSGDRQAVKALTLLKDTRYTETVLIKSAERNSVCVSTQIGCPIGCPFCASGKYGLTRNLTKGEIVGQIILFSRMLKAGNDKVTNIVFMGIGEPLLNYDNAIGAIRFLNQPNTLNLGARRFSISTAGYLPGIEKLAKESAMEVNLAVSLHSAIKKKRDLLVPISKKYPLEELAKALKTYFERTKRKIMLEYVLIKDVNMSEEDAIALRNYINTINAAYVVNLVPLNQTSSDLKAPAGYEIAGFKKHLKKHNVNFVQRFSFGKDIKAACGQLAGDAETL
ncbi:MAG: 23S rRNA (adenine(2503)-C(2))-methyltransferase RlmN [Actinomycetota bacterium]|nr:23S rRNA (adenine(2503)-C(2))-methyltransferase RlmN [Actinomycetota bacterium]